MMTAPRKHGISKLTREPDGTYSCTYGPHEITVRKETVHLSRSANRPPRREPGSMQR